jgi:Primase C terminal 2 (PriCT-2)/RepB DNA-primase from phage plasmid
MDRNESPRSGPGREAVVSPEALQWARKVISDADEELKPDLGAAERHLTLLDETAERFLFCTFDDVKLPDGKKRENKKLTKSFCSTLEECAQKLAKLNQQGAGIFVLVNESNGPDRKRENITRLRALWKEDDRGSTPPLPLEPNLVIETSSGKRHEYLLIQGAPMEGPEWEVVQMRIIDDYGSDPNAKDRCRVLRLAGFYHMKDPANPHLVRILHESGAQPYAWEHVVKALPPADTSDPEAPKEPGDGRKLPEARAALRWLDPDCEYGPWLEVSMALHHASNGGGRGLEVWDKWSRGDLNPAHRCEKYSGDKTLVYKWRSFCSNGNPTGQSTLKSVFKRAHEAGWKNEVTAEDCGLPEGYTLVDIDKLLIDKSIKVAIRTGDLSGNDDARLAVVMALIEAKVSNENYQHLARSALRNRHREYRDGPGAHCTGA